MSAEEAKPRKFTLTREARVSWFDLRQLWATALKTVSATVVGSMSGRREIMAALEGYVGRPYPLHETDDLWLDYVSDCGDGWNASFSVAWLLGRDALVVKAVAADGSGRATEQPIPPTCTAELSLQPEADELLLHHGNPLILGGDQVYPTASIETYQNRFVDPLTCARNWQDGGGRRVFAIPGNHDWYDGLTTFIRLFCQDREGRRWFGAWQTRQRRSYFALRLPHRWWLWGVDMALEDDLDPPQLEYFREQARGLGAGDQVVLVTPTPAWLKGGARRDGAEAADAVSATKLDMMIELITRSGAALPLVLTGDNHYYAHHAGSTPDGDQRHLVVCGGGGAFGLGTAEVPESLVFRGVTMRETAVFPSRAESNRLRWGVLRFPFINIAFSAALAAVQLVLFWLFDADARQASAAGWLAIAGASGSLGDFLVYAGKLLFYKPSTVIWTGLIVLSFAAFGKTGAKADRSGSLAAMVGTVHGLLQIATVLSLTWLVATAFDSAIPSWTILANWGAIALIVPASGLACGLLFGVYLAVSHRLFGMHGQEVFSAQGLEDHKAFLRMHVDASGLTVYPIGLRRVARDWQAAPGVRLRQLSKSILRAREAMETPAGCLRIIDPARPLAIELIEAPFKLSPARQPPAVGR